MNILIQRNNNWATFFWKYSISIGEHIYYLKNKESKIITLENSEEFTLEVTYNKYYKKVAVIERASDCRKIILSSRITNLEVIGYVIISILSLCAFLVTRNNLFIWGGILICSIIGLIYFDLMRKNFFKIKCIYSTPGQGIL